MTFDSISDLAPGESLRDYADSQFCPLRAEAEDLARAQDAEIAQGFDVITQQLDIIASAVDRIRQLPLY